MVPSKPLKDPPQSTSQVLSIPRMKKPKPAIIQRQSGGIFGGSHPEKTHMVSRLASYQNSLRRRPLVAPYV